MNDRIADLVGPVVSALGLDLEAVELSGQGPNRRLRIAVDGDEGVDIGTIADVTRAVSAELDATDLLGSAPYTLEVTSRGVDRPLTAPRHWRRNAGRLVEARLTDGRTLVGRIGDSDDDGVDLLAKGVPTRYSYADIERAVIQIELNRKDV
ncbi:ribosome maturation factor RimP [Aeromicrobium camelliae]|uniref:Ribosome maturation factor RimP n=1 Tax=Aeromicrobium camelliae TaxID=1538144 RepID=A0A3N6WK17_9ACTN|nr:ribosome maturation factor RimP [Aeromicrobium camelliae]RQN07799.1 ribosome maturation factor RimP [Aeromicrobium camelliae]